MWYKENIYLPITSFESSLFLLTHSPTHTHTLSLSFIIISIIICVISLSLIFIIHQWIFIHFLSPQPSSWSSSWSWDHIISTVNWFIILLYTHFLLPSSSHHTQTQKHIHSSLLLITHWLIYIYEWGEIFLSIFFFSFEKRGRVIDSSLSTWYYYLLLKSSSSSSSLLRMRRRDIIFKSFFHSFFLFLIFLFFQIFSIFRFNKNKMADFFTWQQ